MKQKHQIRCSYCGTYTTCRPVSVVYGKPGTTRNSHLYICSRWPAYDSYVGTHRRDRRPLGTPANKELHCKRILAHRLLNALQQNCHMKKWEAYIWLQAKSGPSEAETHIGMFSEYTCDRTIELCDQALETDHIRAA